MDKEMHHDEEGKCEMSHGCEMCHGMCGHHHHRRMMKVLIAFAVVFFVFWCGVQLGELKGMLRSNQYGYSMHGYRGYSVDEVPVNMMGGVDEGRAAAYQSPAATTTTR